MLDLPHARIVQRGPAHTGFTVTRLIKLEELRLIKLENCLARRRSRMKEQQRKSEEEDAEAAIAEHEKDRSGLEGARRRRRKFGG